MKIDNLEEGKRWCLRCGRLEGLCKCRYGFFPAYDLWYGEPSETPDDTLHTMDHNEEVA